MLCATCHIGQVHPLAAPLPRPRSAARAHNGASSPTRALAQGPLRGTPPKRAEGGAAAGASSPASPRGALHPGSADTDSEADNDAGAWSARLSLIYACVSFYHLFVCFTASRYSICIFGSLDLEIIRRSCRPSSVGYSSTRLALYTSASVCSPQHFQVLMTLVVEFDWPTLADPGSVDSGSDDLDPYGDRLSRGLDVGRLEVAVTASRHTGHEYPCVYAPPVRNATPTSPCLSAHAPPTTALPLTPRLYCVLHPSVGDRLLGSRVCRLS